MAGTRGIQTAGPYDKRSGAATFSTGGVGVVETALGPSVPMFCSL